MSDKIFFLIDTDKISNNQFSLNKPESHHLINVLRKDIGTEIWLTDGIGSVYKAVINNIHDNVVNGEILEVYPKYGENKIHISLAIGILRKDKLDFVVEKATECGVNEIIPLILDKSIKRDVNANRLVKVAQSAVKQCGRSIIPNINRPNKLKELLDTYTDTSILVCHESGDNGVAKILRNKSKILLLVGPEGDFSKEEIDFLKDHNANFINLGNRRLRSETAVIVALSQINLYCD